jgi:hypothetical protein
MIEAGMKPKVRSVLAGPVAAIVATLAAIALVVGLLTLLEPHMESVASATTGGLSEPAVTSSVGGPGHYGSGSLKPWQGLLRKISTEDQIRDTLAFNGIFMFGDSISVQDGAALEQTLATRTGDSIAQHDWSGQPTSAAVDALSDWSRTYGLPDRILMATGSNDIFDPPAFAAQIERTMSIAGPNRTVYWVNVEVSRFKVSADTQTADRSNSAWINQQLESAALRHPNLRIIHWSEYLNTQPAGFDKYLRDGVHTTTPLGATARNNLIVDAIEAGRPKQ